MPNPLRVEVTPASTWVAVATNVVGGRVKIGDVTPKWRVTYRVTGDTAPVDLDETDNGAAYVPLGDTMTINNDSPIDVYCWADEITYVMVML
jgi:hypothetical protein